MDNKYYLTINDPHYTEEYFNLLESGVNSDETILIIEHTIPSTVVSPPTVPKDIYRDGFQLVLGQQQSKRITDNVMYHATRKKHMRPSSTIL